MFSSEFICGPIKFICGPIDFYMLHPVSITRVLLVTDATYMTRATHNFKRHRFTPIAAPCARMDPYTGKLRFG